MAIFAGVAHSVYPPYVGDSLDGKQKPDKLDKKSFNEKENQLKKGYFVTKLYKNVSIYFIFFIARRMKLDDNKRTNSESEEEHDKSYSSENHESEDEQSAKPRKRVRTNRMSKAGELLQMYKETETVRVAEKKADSAARDIRHKERMAKSDAFIVVLSALVAATTPTPVEK